jgi:ankyrin repeat protein
LEGHVDVIRYLLGEGAQVNLRDPRYRTALDLASILGPIGTVSLLLAHGADARTAEPVFGFTPLMRASANGHASIVALLLAHGCGDIDRRRFGEQTALHHASFSGHAAAMRELLGAGADPHVVDRHDETPLAMALRRTMWECVRELQVRLAKMSWCPS